MSENKKGMSFLVGIDQYNDPALKSFKGSSARGVGILKRLLDQPASQYWPPQEEFELVHQVTYEELEAKLTKFLSIEDYTDVLIYFSGHGYQFRYQGDKEDKGFLATSNSEISPYMKGETLTHQVNGLAFNMIAELIAKRIKEAKYLKSLVLLIDACHSGHAITADALKSVLHESYIDSLHRSASDGFRYCIIPSSLINEESWIEGELGVFTKTLIDVLENKEHGSITAEGLSNAIKSSLKSPNQQTIKSAQAGSILLMDYPSKGQQKPVQDPIYADPPANTEIKNPYQGLEAFDQNSHDFFFGREVAVDNIIALFTQSAFVPIIGASGSGKSSVVKAGLFPTLTAQDPNWVLMDMKPGADPLGRLKSLLTTKLESLFKTATGEEALQSFESEPTQETFAPLLEHLPQDKKFLLLIDQFEETFTLASQIEDPSRQKKALANQRIFLDIITSVPAPLHIVITLRADFLEPCLKDDGLQALNLFNVS